MPQNGYKKISNFEEITFYICENSSYVNYLKNTLPQKSPQKPKPRNPTRATRMKTKVSKLIPQQTHHTNTKINTEKCAHHHGSRMKTILNTCTQHTNGNRMSTVVMMNKNNPITTTNTTHNSQHSRTKEVCAHD